MKKIIALLLSAILLLSSAPVFASTTAADIAEGITADLLTDESIYAVTRDLDLSAANEAATAEGAQIIWSSSDTDVIAVSDGTAAVNRNQTEIKKVKLTAKVTKDGAAAEKELELVVPPVSTYIFESEGFGHSDLLEQYPNSLGDRWAKSGFKSNLDTYFKALIGVNGGEYALDCVQSAYYTAATPYAIYDFSDMPKSQSLTVEFTVTPKAIGVQNAPEGQIGEYYDFEFFGKNEEGTAISSYLNRLRISNSTSAKVYPTSTSSGYGSNSHTTAVDKATRFCYEYKFGDTPTCTVYAIEGETKTFMGQAASLSADVKAIDYFKFNIQRQGGGGHFIFDDFVISAPKSAVTAEELTDADKGILKVRSHGDGKQVSVISPYAGGSLHQVIGLRNDTTNPHLEHYGAYLVDSNGTETRLDTQALDDTAPFMINALYIGANHGPRVAQITAAAHGKTVADVGTLWSDSADGKWVLAKVVNENTLQFISTKTGSGSSLWVFPHTVSGSTLTQESTSEELTFTKQALGQLYPSIKDPQQKVYTVTEGVRTEISLDTANSYSCDTVIFDETYIITDPTALAQYLQDNRPSEGYSESMPPNYTPGDDVISYHQTITVAEDGTVITEYDHKVLKEVSSLIYYGYQYYMKSDLGGGVKRYLPGTKAFTAKDAVSGNDISFDYSLPALFGATVSQPEGYMVKSGAWADSGKVPNRMVDYMMKGENKTEMGFASGFLPVGDGTDEARIQNTNTSVWLYKTLKLYPYFIEKNKTAANSTITGASYRKYDDTARDGEEVQSYSVSYGSDIYYYVDIFSGVTAKKLTLPEHFGENAVVIENSGEVEYTISGSTITVSGDAKDYLVLKAPKDGAQLRSTKCNILGKVQAVAANVGGEPIVADVICVGYRKGKITAVDVLNNEEIDGGKSRILTFPSDYSQADTYRIFMLDSSCLMKPLCGAKTEAVQ